MSNTRFLNKFKSHLAKLTGALDGEVSLDQDYPKLYQKLIRYYEDRGVQFFNDPDDDYNIILDNVEYDLTQSGIYQ